MTLYYIILYYITLYYIISYYIILHYIILYYITLHYIILHYIILHYITWYYITLHDIILHYIILYYITLYYIIWLYYTCTSYIFHNIPSISRFFPIFARQLPPGECQGSHPVLALQRFLRVGLAAEFHVGRRSTAARRGKDGVEASSVRPGIYLYLGYWIL